MAILNVAHNWKTFAYYLTSPLYIWPFSGWRISTGFWCRFTKDTLIAAKQSREAYKGPLLPYRYQPLPEERPHIRLLHLEPGTFDDPLVGHLDEINLDETEGKYAALSYVWGDATSIQDLVVDGARLGIRLNLDRALRHLRSRTAAIMLWVDAVCIDQASTAEKNYQVALMTRIYAEAQMVHSWLGEATQYSVAGIEILSYLSSNHSFSDNSPWNRMTIDEVVLGLEDVLQRAYFQRIWIVQEGVLGRRIKMHVGDISIQWDGARDAQRFLTRIKLLEVSPAWQAEPLRSIDLRPIRELLEQSVASRDRKAGISRPATLLDLVHGMRHMKSVDPRDKIFALMGLASPADIAGFSPNYGDTWEGTYQNFYELVHRTALQSPDQEWHQSKPVNTCR